MNASAHCSPGAPFSRKSYSPSWGQRSDCGQMISSGWYCLPLSGPVASELRQHLLDLQYGRAEDPHGWMHRLV